MNDDSTIRDNDPVYDLLAEWDERRSLGEDPSPEELCPENPTIREHLRAMIASQKELDARLGLDQTLCDSEAIASIQRPPEISGILLEEEIGRGAMGVVYRGKQEGMGRPVAIKVILGGTHAGPLDRARLRTEAIAIARIRHPNIVAIHDSGESQGLPYLVLEYLDGGSLAQRLAGEPQDPRWAAQLIRTLASAVAVGHARGVVHRDLKPRNILFAADGTPKITDFGLAKILDEDIGQTTTGQSAGTPSYMAPEQAGVVRYAIGPPTDVYALGATLYEALIGRPPFQGKHLFETLELVRTQVPVPPRRLNPEIPRDLETICLKCLEKDPARRYADAEQLAEELGRFLADLPILARPVGSTERFWRWSKRHPAFAVLASVSGVLLAVLIAGAFYMAGREHRMRIAIELAEQREEARADALAYLRNVELADRALSGNMADRCDELLAECPPQHRGWEWHYLRRARRGDQRLLRGHEGRITGVAFNHAGTQIASASWDWTGKIWDARTGRLIHTLRGHDNRLSSIAFAPDDLQLASGSHDQTVKLWDARTGKELRTFTGHTDKVFGVAFSPDGTRIASVGLDGCVRVWDSSSGQEIRALLAGSSDPLYFVAFSADGGRIAASGGHGVVKIWDLSSGRLTVDYRNTSLELGRGVMFNEVDQCMAFFGDTRSLIRLTLPESGESVLSLEGHTAAVTDLAIIGGDGTRIASSSRDRTVKVWDMATGREMLTLRGHTAPVSGIASSPDGMQIASVSEDQTIRIWDATPLRPEESVGRDIQTFRGHQGPVTAALYSPDGTRVVSASDDQTIRSWDSANGKEVVFLRGHSAPVRTLAFHPDGTRIASASEDGEAKIWSLATGKVICQPKNSPTLIWVIAFRPDGGQLASAGVDRVIRFWDPRDGRNLGNREGCLDAVRCLAYSPDGALGAFGEWNEVRLEVWPSGRNSKTLSGHSTEVLSVSFSPGGTKLASGSADGTARIWDVATATEILKLEGHGAGVYGVAFSPDGAKLATASRDTSLRVWDAENGNLLFILRGHNERVRSVAFSPDGTRLVSASDDRTVKIWDLLP